MCEHSKSSFVILETEPFNNGYGYCISGFSSTGFSNQNNKMPFYFVGAPGSSKYRGNWLFIQSSTKNFTKVLDFFDLWYFQSLNDSSDWFNISEIYMIQVIGGQF